VEEGLASADHADLRVAVDDAAATTGSCLGCERDCAQTADKGQSDLWLALAWAVTSQDALHVEHRFALRTLLLWNPVWRAM